jgi:hypothetical protein
VAQLQAGALLQLQRRGYWRVDGALAGGALRLIEVPQK